MSRVGKTVIPVPKDVKVDLSEKQVVCTGTKGSLVYPLTKDIHLALTDGNLMITNTGKGKNANAVYGSTRANIANIVIGVSKGWSKTLELSGVGYRAAVTNGNLVLSVGYSHQVTIAPPKEISFSVVEGKIVISGIDKQKVGQVAADVRKVKEPEPYKGKGIKYVGEKIRKKAGKTAKAVGGAPGATK